MKTIEIEMMNAVNCKYTIAKGGTCVMQWENSRISLVILHKSELAVVHYSFGPSPLREMYVFSHDLTYGKVYVNTKTLARYPTNTTLSRLRALGCNVTRSKGVVYLNGVALTGEAVA